MTHAAGGDDARGAAQPPLAVRARGLRKRFGFKDTLKGVDIALDEGQRFVVFGPNGAGKSTLLRILATQWSFSAGEVEVLGRRLPGERVALRREIGLVLHDSFLRAELTLEENLRFACDLHDLRFAAVRERVEALLVRVSLLPRRHDRVGTFSQGMKKRASLVLSLLHAPRLWILDEPFSGLDPEGQELLGELITDFSGNGRTVLLVTHHESRGLALATRWIRMRDGRVAEADGGRAA